MVRDGGQGTDTLVAFTALIIQLRGEDKYVHDRDVEPKGKPTWAPSDKI